jgi:pullulanase/glycogen debranching enzyme
MTATCVSVSNNMSPVLQTPCRPERLDMLTNVTTGSSAPLGTTPSRGGVNFSVYSSHATGVELLLFDHVDDASAARVIRIDPIANRTYHYWHVFVPGLSPGQIYGYRVEGPWDPARGMRSIQRKSFSIPMAAELSFLVSTDAPPPARRVATVPPR